MTSTQTQFGQSAALADVIVAGLNGAEFCLPVLAVRRFVRRRELKDLPGISNPVAVDVFPGVVQVDRMGLDGVYDDTYGIHVILQQSVTDTAVSGTSEAQISLLLQLQSQIIEFLCSPLVTVPQAVHPFRGARVMAVRNGDDGIYSLPRLEDTSAFYCDTIFTYKVGGLRRRAT